MTEKKDQEKGKEQQVDEPFCTTAPDPEHHRGAFSPEELDPCYDYRAGELPGIPGAASTEMSRGIKKRAQKPHEIRETPVPGHFDPGSVGEIRRVPYLDRAREAEEWASAHGIHPASEDRVRVCLLCIDIQNTFCTPGFELFVGGRSGNAAVEDNVRLCTFIYKNLSLISRIIPTMDSHQAMQIFHPLFLVNDRGEHPEPMTVVTQEDVRAGRWRVASDVCASLGLEEDYAREHLLRYTGRLQEKQRYDLIVWPYHGMLGGIGHALVPAFEEAVFFHTVARKSQADFNLKGGNPLTESYSVLGPEVREGPGGRGIAQKNQRLLSALRGYDAVLVAGQAKSHCVAWTLDDLLKDIRREDGDLAGKIYLLEDGTSPVVVPGVADFTEQADEAFERFKKAGMHGVRTSEPVASWPGMKEMLQS